MRTIEFCAAVTVIIGSVLRIQPSPSSSPPRYTIVDLNANGRGITYARGLNNRGEVIGILFGAASVGKLYSHGKLTKLQPFGDLPASEASYINDMGLVVGDSRVRILAGLHRTRACMWVKGQPRDLGLLPGDNMSDASAINNSGAIVGMSGTFDLNQPEKGRTRVVTWAAGRIRALEGIPGEGSYALDINESGVILGMRIVSDSEQRPFIYIGGKARDLPLPRAGTCFAVSLNDKGLVVGERHSSDKASHAVLWNNGRIIDLVTPAGTKDSRALDINNSGQIVSSCGSATFRGGACLWENGRIHDLNVLIPNSTGWILQTAQAVNDKGQIVGSGTHYGNDRTFLLTPVRSK